MSRRYEGEDDGDYVDRVTDDAIQREVDDEVEARAMESKRNASQITPEILSLQDAFADGARVGSMGFGANLNPYQSDVPEHAEWERGRMSALGAYMTSRRAA